MLMRIHATDLPGRVCPGDSGFPGYDNVHVGVQRRDRREDIMGLHPGDAPSALWIIECEARGGPAGVDIRGPHIQGRPGARFVYLAWGAVDGIGHFTGFRRAKLMLDAVDPEIAEAALRSGTLRARLGLTDAKGHPLCAAVRPPAITWSAG
ncbi:monooxygenase [Sphaerisporangium album]|uniref:Monooxygenase n=1 Tax=Sphaerisporangium album TaxID=509200 RepID=A0A367F3S9_9ACTN|nr:DUF5990 family protein [Sphaerisporangium album]RCG25016.1 monooxygenase [Sphaerisporangium album]